MNILKIIFIVFLVFYPVNLYSNNLHKCSSQASINKLKNLILSNIELDALGLTIDMKDQFKQIYYESIDIHSSIPIDYNESILRYKCNGTLEIKNKFKGAIEYYSQIGDNGDHVVSVKITWKDSLFIRNTIISIISENEKIKKESRNEISNENNKNNISKIPDVILNKYIESNKKHNKDYNVSKEDILYRSRDIDNDGIADWVVWESDFCGSGGCTGEIYILKNNQYCYAGEGDVHMLIDSNLFKRLECQSN